jgi:anthranilate synthase component 2
MLVIIDNYDSFTWNLVQYFGELGEEVEVFRNDAVTPQEIAALKPGHLVISPGPGTPNEAGISLEAIRHFAGKVPILGVCLGHQCIGQLFGGTIVRAPRIMHGKVSPVRHESAGVFRGLPEPLQSTRYHSLVIDPDSVPAELEVTAWTEDEAGGREAIMGICHRVLPIEGVQFHPESILSDAGHQLLRNFLAARPD